MLINSQKKNTQKQIAYVEIDEWRSREPLAQDRALDGFRLSEIFALCHALSTRDMCERGVWSDALLFSCVFAPSPHSNMSRMTTPRNIFGACCRKDLIVYTINKTASLRVLFCARRFGVCKACTHSKLVLYVQRSRWLNADIPVLRT